MSNLTMIYRAEQLMRQQSYGQEDIEMLCHSLEMEQAQFRNSFRLYLGRSPKEYLEKIKIHQEGTKGSFFELTDAEQIVAFYPAPKHQEYDGHRFYQAHQEIYDSLIGKGYFGADQDYVLAAKQITEKYANECQLVMLKKMKAGHELDVIRQSMQDMYALPQILFYFFLHEITVNEQVQDLLSAERVACNKCKSFLATIYDANYIRDEVVNNIGGIKERNAVNCLGIKSNQVAAYCKKGQIYE